MQIGIAKQTIKKEGFLLAIITVPKSIAEDVTEIVPTVRLITVTDMAGGIMGTVIARDVNTAVISATVAEIDVV